MSAGPPSPERLAEVVRLCTLLADRALDAFIMKRSIPSEQVAALAKAARLLKDHGVEWPPLLAQVLHDLVEGSTAHEAAIEVPAPPPNALPDVDLHGVTQFFANLGKGKRRP